MVNTEEMRTRQKISNKIRAALKEDDITQADLARMIGVDDRTIGYYIHMERTPSIQKAKDIANVLGMSLDELVS